MWQDLRERSIKHSEITCRIELDIGPGTAESSLFLNSTTVNIQNTCISLGSFLLTCRQSTSI